MVIITHYDDESRRCATILSGKDVDNIKVVIKLADKAQLKDLNGLKVVDVKCELVYGSEDKFSREIMFTAMVNIEDIKQSISTSLNVFKDYNGEGGDVDAMSHTYLEKTLLKSLHPDDTYFKVPGRSERCYTLNDLANNLAKDKRMSLFNFNKNLNIDLTRRLVWRMR